MRSCILAMMIGLHARNLVSRFTGKPSKLLPPDVTF